MTCLPDDVIAKLSLIEALIQTSRNNPHPLRSVWSEIVRKCEKLDENREYDIQPLVNWVLQHTALEKRLFQVSHAVNIYEQAIRLPILQNSVSVWEAYLEYTLKIGGVKKFDEVFDRFLSKQNNYDSYVTQTFWKVYNTYCQFSNLDQITFDDFINKAIQRQPQANTSIAKRKRATSEPHTENTERVNISEQMYELLNRLEAEQRKLYTDFSHQRMKLVAETTDLENALRSEMQRELAKCPTFEIASTRKIYTSKLNMLVASNSEKLRKFDNELLAKTLKLVNKQQTELSLINFPKITIDPHFVEISRQTEFLRTVLSQRKKELEK